jgi:hypothetical protein
MLLRAPGQKTKADGWLTPPARRRKSIPRLNLKRLNNAREKREAIIEPLHRAMPKGPAENITQSHTKATGLSQP